ncbi:hypothetical protein SK128_023047 [Halocaridina rubra]|uniref:Uncharacterized protein n=1 Tax=Halocaridina rubra TaxID=373956 RepID=A0AAN8X1V5_HALRR
MRLSVKELISAILFFLVASAAAQKPVTIGADVANTGIEIIAHEGKTLKQQITGEGSVEGKLTPSVLIHHPKVLINAEGNQRYKRKVIFGGGSYGHSSRRGGVGGDPYGRRRGHYGHQGPYDSWPYRRPDFPNSNTPMYGSPTSTGTSYRSSTSIPTDTENSNRGQDDARDTISPDESYATVRTTSAHSVLGLNAPEDETSASGKSKPVNRRTHSHSKAALTRLLKLEIAKFALQYGIERAAERYSDMTGRTLKPKKIQKFIKRYQKQQKKERDDASLEVDDQLTKDGTMYDVVKTEQKPLGRKLDYRKNEINGKDLDSEEYSDEYDYDEDDDDYEYDSSENETGDDDAFSALRVKRKVIFGGGGAGGGGIYSRGGRRGGGEEDPYGRRREHNGPMYGPHDSWPYRRPDIPSHVQTTSHVTPSTTGSEATESSNSNSAPVYGITRTHTPDSESHASDNYDGPDTSERSDGRKSKASRRETPKGKLSRNLKWEIAQYAVQHGAEKAAQHYESLIGRRLRVKKIEKFIKRYQDKEKN